MSVRILHTADWQLGKPFRNIPGDAGAALREERFHVVRRIAELACQNAVDAVLVAGDAFDSNEVSNDRLYRARAAMAPFEGPWLLLPGNHDPATAVSVWTRLAELAGDVSIIACTTATPVAIAHGRAAVLPAPLTARRSFDDPTVGMDEVATADGVVRIGLAHGSITGFLPEAAEPPNAIAADRAERARLDYLALGDWHEPRSIGPRTRYAGTPEPDGFDQEGAGAALMVEIEEAGASPRITALRTGRYRWQQRRLVLGDDPAARLAASLDGLEDPHHTLIRLVLEGDVDLAARGALASALERLRGSLHWLDTDESGLVVRPGPDDLALLDDGGLIGEVFSSLRREADGEDGASARRAIEILYREAAAAA